MSMGLVTLKINGKEVTVKEGTLILDAAKEAGFDIPTFCYQANLSGLGSCRMCLVEIEGQRKLQPSCITPVMPDMSVFTETETVKRTRSAMLEFLLSNHPLDCPVCDKGGECELQDLVYKHGPRKGRFAEDKVRHHDKDYILSPVIVKNANRCVQCMRCVRVCKEVVGRGVLGAVGRGVHQEETSFLRTRLDCDHCGMCIEVCPVGSFMRLPYRYKARPWDLVSAKSVCGYCGTGCRLTLERRGDTVVRAIAHPEDGFNRKLLCARGRFGYDVMNSEERVKTPLLKERDGTFKPVSWDRALELLKENILRAGAERTAGIVSATLTNEELYLFQKFMREVAGSSNIDSTSRWSAESSLKFIEATGINGGGSSVYGCAESDVVVVLGGQLSEENPVTDYIIRYITGARRNTLVIASPRGMKLDSSAQLSVRTVPATTGAFVAALLKALVEKKDVPIEGMDAIKGLSIDELSGVCGVSVDDIHWIAARLLAAGSVGILAGPDLLRHDDGSEELALLIEVLKATVRDVRVLPFLDRANQRGAWDMGVHPYLKPGYREAEKKGLDVHGIVELAESGGLGCLYLMGEDLAGLYPDRALIESALSKVGFLVVQDSFMTESARMAHLVLPLAMYGERAGTMTNQEGRVQRVEPVRKPEGDVWTALDTITRLGNLIDKDFPVQKSGDVLREIQQQVAGYGDLRGMESFKGASAEGVAELEPAFNYGAPERGAEEFWLLTGNHLFHGARLSQHSGILKELLGECVVEIGRAAAERLGVAEGDVVEVEGDDYMDRLPVRIREGTPDGVAFIPENFDGRDANRFLRKDRVISTVKIRASKKQGE